GSSYPKHRRDTRSEAEARRFWIDKRREKRRRQRSYSGDYSSQSDDRAPRRYEGNPYSYSRYRQRPTQ
ncbi:unnamed protein product, partial [Candidula unifasciata]